jgi:hypothetical protein
MSLGLGIFLSSLLVVSALVYRWNRDRWNWRRIGRWTAGVACLLLLAAAGLTLYAWLENQPGPQTEYYGIALGASRDEVTYRLGMPTGVYAPTEGDCADPTQKPWCQWQEVIALSDLPAGKRIHDYAEWFFEVKPRVTVRFDGDGRVNGIECYWSEETYGVLDRCEDVLGLGTRATEETVISRLGEPQHAELDGFVKTMDYPQFNVQLLLTKGQVYMLVVKDFRPVGGGHANP